MDGGYYGDEAATRASIAARQKRRQARSRRSIRPDDAPAGSAARRGSRGACAVRASSSASASHLPSASVSSCGAWTKRDTAGTFACHSENPTQLSRQAPNIASLCYGAHNTQIQIFRIAILKQVSSSRMNKLMERI